MSKKKRDKYKKCAGKVSRFIENSIQTRRNRIKLTKKDMKCFNETEKKIKEYVKKKCGTKKKKEKGRKKRKKKRQKGYIAGLPGLPVTWVNESDRERFNNHWCLIPPNDTRTPEQYGKDMLYERVIKSLFSDTQLDIMKISNVEGYLNYLNDSIDLSNSDDTLKLPLENQKQFIYEVLIEIKHFKDMIKAHIEDYNWFFQTFKKNHYREIFRWHFPLLTDEEIERRLRPLKKVDKYNRDILYKVSKMYNDLHNIYKLK